MEETGGPDFPAGNVLTYEECQDVDGAVWRGNQATENDGFTLDLGCPVHITKVILTNGFRMGIRCE